MTAQPELRIPHSHRTPARVGGTLLLIGGALAYVLMAVAPGFVHGKVVPTLTVASVAIVAGVFCIIRPDRVPSWFLPVMGPFGTVLIGISSVLTRTTTDGSELLYMWSVLFTTYFLPLRQALMNLLLIAVLYPSIALWVMGPRAITPSVYLVGTSVVTLLIVSSLRRQITGVITAAALEARTDQLTGLANRRSWGEALDRELGRQRRSGGRLCVLVVDLDHFKRLNDTHGHAAGDAALAAIATVLRTHARKSDVLARVGGEEFALLIPDCPVAEGYRRAHEIRLAVERLSGGWITPVTVSVGVAALPDHARTGDELMAAGDIALYQAKRDGRNTVCAYRVETPPGRTSAPTGPAVANADQAG